MFAIKALDYVKNPLFIKIKLIKLLVRIKFLSFVLYNKIMIHIVAVVWLLPFDKYNWEISVSLVFCSKLIRLKTTLEQCD